MGNKIITNIDDYSTILDDFEKHVYYHAMIEAGGNKSKVSRMLGVSRGTVSGKVSKHNIAKYLTRTGGE